MKTVATEYTYINQQNTDSNFNQQAQMQTSVNKHKIISKFPNFNQQIYFQTSINSNSINNYRELPLVLLYLQ